MQLPQALPTNIPITCNHAEHLYSRLSLQSLQFIWSLLGPQHFNYNGSKTRAYA